MRSWFSRWRKIPEYIELTSTDTIFEIGDFTYKIIFHEGLYGPHVFFVQSPVKLDKMQLLASFSEYFYDGFSDLDRNPPRGGCCGSSSSEAVCYLYQSKYWSKKEKNKTDLSVVGYFGPRIVVDFLYSQLVYKDDCMPKLQVWNKRLVLTILLSKKVRPVINKDVAEIITRMIVNRCKWKPTSGKNN
jgi:hypothetical protein